MQQIFSRYKLIIVFTSVLFLIFSTLFIVLKKHKKPLSKLTVMIVGKHKLSAKQFANRINQHIKNWSLADIKNKKKIQVIKNKVLDDYIFEIIVQNWVTENNIHLHEIEIKKEIQKQQQGYPNQDVFFFALFKAGISIEQWKKKIKTSLMIKKLKHHLNKNISPFTEKEIDHFYNENKDQFKLKPVIFLRQVLLKEKFKADILRKKINKNNFKEMAENFSISPEKAEGGALGWIEKGQTNLFDRIFKLQVGKISKVIASPYGYHIFLIEKKINQKKDLLKRTKAKIAKKLMEQKRSKYFQNWLKKQIQTIKVYKDLNLIDKIKISIKK